MKVLVIGCLVLEVGCAGGGRYGGEVSAALEAAGRAPAQFASPASLAPAAWQIGQWALYEHNDANPITTYEGVYAYSRFTVVGRDDCGWWVEILYQSIDTPRLAKKVCFESQPQGKAGEASPASLAKVVVIPGGREESGDVSSGMVVHHVDIRAPQTLERSKDPVRLTEALAHEALDFDWRLGDAPLRRDLTVPAGTFRQSAVSKGKIEWRSSGTASPHEAWFHPAVPVTGLVTCNASDGVHQNLVAFGQTGGKAEVR